MYNLVFGRYIADDQVTFITSTCYVFDAHAQELMLSVQCFCYQETIDTQTLIYVCCYNEIIFYRIKISGCYIYGGKGGGGGFHLVHKCFATWFRQLEIII